jgi:regulation of enolase protein 1 (concanavalin A-like superfamily)
VYAIAFKGAAEFGADMANPLDFYFDDQRVTPNAQDLNPNPTAWRPGTGFGRDPNAFVDYGTVPVYVSGPGRHTFRIVGRGNPNQTTVIDDVRVASTDAIFASRIPGGGQAAGQVSRSDYQAQLNAQARYARAYGLKVVSYEGGWSLGGDTQSVPIQSWAKYRDGRAADVMAAAIDAFYRAGGELNVVGTYDQWYLDDAANASNYPLVRGIDSRVGALPSGSPAPSPPPANNPPPASVPPVQANKLPAGWASDAIGDPDIDGSAQYDRGRWTVQGAGQNIWGSADEFQFAHAAGDGDMVLTARVDDVERTHGWAKAGLMVRAGTGESAPFAGVFRTPDNGVVFETRSASRSTPTQVSVAVPDGPVWVRLVRRANSFAAYYSTDGQRWTRIDVAQTVPMPNSVQVGLAVTSHDPRQLATARFSNVTISN